MVAGTPLFLVALWQVFVPGEGASFAHLLVWSAVLYLGFTGMAIPFAFAVAALATGRLDAGWIAASRRWLLVAFIVMVLVLTAWQVIQLEDLTEKHQRRDDGRRHFGGEPHDE